MAETFKGKVEEAGHKIAETATKVGNKVSEKVEEAADWAKEKSHQAGHRLNEAAQKAEHAVGFQGSTSGVESKIREHMDVYGSCGSRVGRVDHVEGSTIKLTKNDSPDGQHHLIPIGWVDHVDSSVHLNMSCDDAQREWDAT